MKNMILPVEKWNSITFVVVFASLCFFGSCGHTNTPEIVERPNTTIPNINRFTTSMPAILSLPEELRLTQTADDVLSAYIEGDLRGTAQWIDSVFYISILGTDDDEGLVTFSYWSNASHHLYHATETYPFNPDTIIGSPDHPLILHCY